MENNVDIRQVQDELSKHYLNESDVYGVGVMQCDCCGKDYLEVLMNTKNKDLVKKIPNKINGFKVEKKFSDPIVLQKAKPVVNVTPEEATMIKITNKGTEYLFTHLPKVGKVTDGFYVLILIRDGVPHKIADLKKSKRKLKDWNGIIKLLLDKKLILIS
jgi:hypothetical protein